MPVDIILNPTPHADNWFIKKWLATPRGEFIDMGDYGQPYENVDITSSEVVEVWIDDPFNIEQEWVNKLRALDCPKKKRKLKQQVPYWANNWRKK